MANEIKPTPRGQAIALPPETAKKWAFTKPIFGGPVFDFPAFGMTRVNLSELTPQVAERLYKKGWAGIAPVAEYKEEAAAPSKAFGAKTKVDGE